MKASMVWVVMGASAREADPTIHMHLYMHMYTRYVCIPQILQAEQGNLSFAGITTAAGAAARVALSARS